MCTLPNWMAGVSEPPLKSKFFTHSTAMTRRRHFNVLHPASRPASSTAAIFLISALFSLIPLLFFFLSSYLLSYSSTKSSDITILAGNLFIFFVAERAAFTGCYRAQRIIPFLSWKSLYQCKYIVTSLMTSI